MAELFKNSNDFSLFIEKNSKQLKLGYLDTILKYCEDNYIDTEEVAKLINKSLKEKIAFELTKTNYFPKKQSLDL